MAVSRVPNVESALSAPVAAHLAANLAAQLTTWFALRQRTLPWRETSLGRRSPYRVWLAEIMLQQTRVSVVVDYFNRFIARFPAVGDLAAASEDEVLSLWSGLGYYARGRNLHKAARAVVVDHGGVFPDTAAQLRTLPGVGDYTAAAIASLAFGERTAVLDGNVARVLSRLHDDATAIDTPRGKRHFTALAQALVDAAPKDGAGEVNEALMELGALVCTPKSPSCASCPWLASCRGRERAVLLPVKAKKNAKKHVRIAVVVVTDAVGRFWLEKRASAGLFGGLWEPPGVVLDDDSADGDSSSAELGWRRVLLERGLAAPAVWPAPIVVQRTLTHRELRFELLRLVADPHTLPSTTMATTPTTPATPTTATAATPTMGGAGQWFSVAELGSVGTSTAVRTVLDAARLPRLL